MQGSIPSILISIFFVFTGTMHFLIDDFLVQIVPPMLPFKYELVYFSGLIEIMCGILINFKIFRKQAAWGLVLLLIAVFPANIYMSLAPEKFSFIPEIFLYLRLPLQAFFIYWAYKFC